MIEYAAINSPAAAFVAGVITSLHCAGMCGPLACTIMPVRGSPGAKTADPHFVATSYHTARLTGYAILGGIGGALGDAPLHWLSGPALKWVPWAFVFLFVALALRWDRHLPKAGALGRLAWKLRGWTQGRAPSTTAAIMGLATPLLPCGPLYFLVTLALLSGSALRGVEFMLAFGLGTVPLLWLAQTQFQWVRQKLSPLWLDRTRIALGLATAFVIAWRLRATLGFEGPDATNFLCH